MKRLLRWVGLALLASAFVVVAGCNLFNAAPVANFDWSPEEPLAREEVEFEDTSTDEGGLFGSGAVTSWNWDFDDNDSENLQNPDHGFDKSGDYDVTLTVTDAGGKTSTVEKTVEVAPSLHGTWKGTWDSCANFFDLTLELNHSRSGGISGIMYIALQAYPLDGASIVGSQVSISLLGGLILQGQLSADEHSMQGQWSFQGNTGCTWSVTLQD
ncbi:MAG: PKD domain-containing protein [Candidatus Bipolaricaulota bacterium]|nr:PKD domain-containing protein [Candidatus Bipolaricaulota bacterium]